MKNKTTDIAFICTCRFIELQHEFTNKIVTETSSMDGIMGWMQIFSYGFHILSVPQVYKSSFLT